MTDRRFAFAAAVAATLAATAPLTTPAFANDQLIASAGLTAEEAQGLSLNQIAAAKYNRDRSFSDRQAVVIDRAGDPVALNARAVAIYNAGKGAQDAQPVRDAAAVSMATRSAGGAQAGDPLEARAIDLYNRGKSATDRQSF